jgi:hypothetical protein
MQSFCVRRVLPALVAMALPLVSAAQDSPKKLSLDQMEVFLQRAKIINTKMLNTGITHSSRASLSDGTIVHNAHVQSIDEAKTIFQGDRGTELNFRDTWKFNVAGYRLARILGISDMVPPSVERSVEGKTSAVTWWVDNAMMESDRQKKKIAIQDKDAWNREMHVVRVFDQLIFNTDRNLQNLMIDEHFRLWMIDHSRAFRTLPALREKKDLQMCDRALLARLRTLTLAEVQTLKPYLNDPEIKGLLSRRDKIVQLFDELIKVKGESAVLYDRPSR